MLPLQAVSLILSLVSISDKKWEKNCHNKCVMSLSLQVFAWKSRPWCHICFVENERLECKIKVSLGYYSAFIDIICRNYTRSYDIHSFSYPDVGAIFDKSILSRSHKLAGADLTGTLDSCSGIQNEQKNTQNNVIQSETRTLSTQVYRVTSYANPGSKNFRSCLIHFLGTVSTDYFSQLLPITKCSPQSLPHRTPIATAP